MRIAVLVTVGSLMLSVLGCSDSRMRRAGDYFDEGIQRSLAEAAGAGNTEEVDHLLTKGAKIDFRGKEGMTALIWALLDESKIGYEHLLKKGANPNLQMSESTLTSSGYTDGNAAISLAAKLSDPWWLQVALEHGGDPNLKNPFNDETPVVQCISLYQRSDPSARMENLKLLIAAGADLNFQGKRYFTPMMEAANANRFDMVYAMLAGGADPRKKTRSGSALATFVVESNTDPNSEAYKWREKVIQLLKERGIDVNKPRG